MSWSACGASGAMSFSTTRHLDLGGTAQVRLTCPASGTTCRYDAASGARTLPRSKVEPELRQFAAFLKTWMARAGLKDPPPTNFDWTLEFEGRSLSGALSDARLEANLPMVQALAGVEHTLETLAGEKR